MENTSTLKVWLVMIAAGALIFSCSSIPEKEIIHVIRKLKDYRRLLNYMTGFLICIQSRLECVVQIEYFSNERAFELSLNAR